MNKQELVHSIAEKSGNSQAHSSEMLNAFMETVEEALAAGDNVMLVGFGTFSVQARKAREGRNPRTGETVQIPAKNVAKFKASDKLNEKL